MYKKFEVDRTKIRGEFQTETKVSQMISNSQLPLVKNPQFYSDQAGILATKYTHEMIISTKFQFIKIGVKL